MSAVKVDIGPFQALIFQISGRRTASLHRLGDKALGYSQDWTPVLSGNLRDSEEVEYDDARGIARLIATAHYAEKIHDGTGRMAPRPFMAQAFDAIEPDVKAELEGWF